MLDSATSSTSSHVPGEFIGLGRQFRNVVHAEDRAIDAAVDVIIAPLRERLRKHPRLRAETPLGVVRQWAQSVPSIFRIGHPRVAHHKTEFVIREHRILSSWLHNDEWNNDERERGVSVCEVTFGVRKRKLIARWSPIANISLHALARWFQRSGLRDHAALIEALAVLVETDESSDRVPTSGGFWRGGVTEAIPGAQGLPDSERADVARRLR
jgi:hypothetical protein